MVASVTPVDKKTGNKNSIKNEQSFFPFLSLRIENPTIRSIYLFKLVEEWRKNIYNNYFIAAVMIAKLVAYGFNKNMLSYIYSYINSRKQCFSINNVKSTFKERISGVSTSSHQRCSVKKVFSEVSRNSQENTFSRVSFFIKLQA